ncbi:MAG: 7-cyano-7-deazaguanine synthase QueC [Xanthomonadales bacterium]|nr:7-cyano-7-deazaguanine synthase QueC [Xanthomonadales bacterium]
MTGAKRAVVLLSGGLDSATTLAIAVDGGFECRTLAVDYGQRHRSELAASAELSRMLGAVDHRIIRIDLRAIGGSALTADIEVPTSPAEGIPVTYVPARNTILLGAALGYAETLGSTDLFIGVNAVDYSGYPDCRPAFIRAFEELAHVATKAGVEGSAYRIHTPLIDLTKAEIVKRGAALGVDYSRTVSCYRADDEGRACGKCDSCRFRAQGFSDAGLPDPTRYRV